MFVGHFAIGFAAKPAAPRASLGTLLFAALFSDFLVWLFVVLGVEHIAIKPGITTTNPLDLYDFPISHSLVMDVFWALLLAGIYYAYRKYPRGAALIFAAVLSHWVLDFISHRPDMPLAPGIHLYYGLSLFNSRIGMLIVEGALWLAGIFLYVRATRFRGRLPTYAFWIVIALITWVWLISLRGAPPPGGDIKKIGSSSLVFMTLVVAWAYWTDWRSTNKQRVLCGIPPLTNDVSSK